MRPGTTWPLWPASPGRKTRVHPAQRGTGDTVGVPIQCPAARPASRFTKFPVRAALLLHADPETQQQLEPAAADPRLQAPGPGDRRRAPGFHPPPHRSRRRLREACLSRYVGPGPCWSHCFGRRQDGRVRVFGTFQDPSLFSRMASLMKRAPFHHGSPPVGIDARQRSQTRCAQRPTCGPREKARQSFGGAPGRSESGGAFATGACSVAS